MHFDGWTTIPATNGNKVQHHVPHSFWCFSKKVKPKHNSVIMWSTTQLDMPKGFISQQRVNGCDVANSIVVEGQFWSINFLDTWTSGSAWHGWLLNKTVQLLLSARCKATSCGAGTRYHRARQSMSTTYVIRRRKNRPNLQMRSPQDGWSIHLCVSCLCCYQQWGWEWCSKKTQKRTCSTINQLTMVMVNKNWDEVCLVNRLSLLVARRLRTAGLTPLEFCMQYLVHTVLRTEVVSIVNFQKRQRFSEVLVRNDQNDPLKTTSTSDFCLCVFGWCAQPEYLVLLPGGTFSVGPMF